MEGSFEQIKKICFFVAELYETAKNKEVNTLRVSQILEKAGK
jgi:hypothetical protein